MLMIKTDPSLAPEEIEAQAQNWLGQMSLDEKIDQMSGDLPYFPTVPKMFLAYNTRPFPAGKNKRLGIPELRFTDGPRGVVMKDATTFPATAARGAAWDPALEEQIGEAMGIEARALGADLVAAVCINLLRHPAWGRAQETYGEDPYHLGEMGAALVRGIQRHAMACVKHYACNSIEDTRMKVDVKISERTLREVYLPHFKRCVGEGLASVMSAYNQVNGAYCAENPHLLRDILKGEWGFTGFVMSDFVMGLHDAEKGLRAGLDLEMPVSQHYGRKLKRLVQADPNLASLVDEAVLRLLRQKIRFAGLGKPEWYTRQAVAGPDHRALARRAAVESIVLLKNAAPSAQRMFPAQRRDLGSLFSTRKSNPMQYNLRVSDGQRIGAIDGQNLDEPILPLSLYKHGKLAVIGRLAVHPNLGDRGSSNTRPANVVTPLQGIQAAVGGRFEVFFHDGLSSTDASDLARGCETAIVFVGLTDKEEGENMFTHGGDRQKLGIPENEMAMLLTIVSLNPRTVVVVMGSGMVMMDKWEDYIPAILLAWYPGMEGGHAIADILFGQANPSGKLPVTFPAAESQLPVFDNHSAVVEYGFYHGYRLLERKGQQPAYPFGFGLSYTTFSYSDLHVAGGALDEHGALHASVQVANIGLRAGDEVVQLYISCPGEAVERPLKELKGFRRVHLNPGEKQTLEFEVPVPDLAYYDEERSTWAVETGTYAVHIGGSSAEKALLTAKFKVIRP
jgi:beta-glucosidase